MTAARLHVTEVVTEARRRVYYHLVVDGEEYRYYYESRVNGQSASRDWWAPDELTNVLKWCVERHRCTIVDMYSEAKADGDMYVFPIEERDDTRTIIVKVVNGKMIVEE